MTPFLQLTFALAIIISLAKLGGYLSFRIGQPAVLGELLVGILLGPSILDFLHLSIFTDQHLHEVIQELAEVGVMLLMFLAGLELHISELLKSTKVAVFAGVLGVVFPLLMGAGGGALFNLAPKNAFFLGLTLAATSVSISAQTLMELNRLRSKIGFGLLGAAVFDDVLVVLGLSVFTALAMPDSGGQSGIAMILNTIVRMALFLALSSIIGYFLLPVFSLKIFSLEISQGLISFVFVSILLFGWLADVLEPGVDLLCLCEHSPLRLAGRCLRPDGRHYRGVSRRSLVCPHQPEGTNLKRYLDHCLWDFRAHLFCRCRIERRCQDLTGQ